MSKPAHITRFEKLLARGRFLYLMSTALSVAGVIAAIQMFNDGQLSYKSIVLYALIGAIIAQVDWLILAKRYHKHNNPNV
jgi:Co/Zn/Cd efflux system component